MKLSNINYNIRFDKYEAIPLEQFDVNHKFEKGIFGVRLYTFRFEEFGEIKHQNFLLEAVDLSTNHNKLIEFFGENHKVNCVCVYITGEDFIKAQQIKNKIADFNPKVKDIRIII